MSASIKNTCSLVLFEIVNERHRHERFADAALAPANDVDWLIHQMVSLDFVLITAKRERPRGHHFLVLGFRFFDGRRSWRRRLRHWRDWFTVALRRVRRSAGGGGFGIGGIGLAWPCDPSAARAGGGGFGIGGVGLPWPCPISAGPPGDGGFDDEDGLALGFGGALDFAARAVEGAPARLASRKYLFRVSVEILTPAFSTRASTSSQLRFFSLRAFNKSGASPRIAPASLVSVPSLAHRAMLGARARLCPVVSHRRNHRLDCK